MMDDVRAYQPDFPAETWTDAERALLAPFVMNPDGFVTVIHNLPAEIVGALCSRASRASGSLIRILLDEYLRPIMDGDPALADELRLVVQFLTEHGFKNILNNQRAQSFYARWLSQFGDDSIAQMTGAHVVFRGISQVAMKHAEDQRIALEPIEKSTRFVNYGEKVGGKYLYYVPEPVLRELGLVEEYCRVMDGLFDAYVALVPQFLAWLKQNYAEKESVLEKKAFDTLRGLLPMATVSQVAFRGNAQAFEYLINRTAAHPLGEFRWMAQALKEELDCEIPSLLLRLQEEKSERYQEYLGNRKSRTREFLESFGLNRDIMDVFRTEHYEGAEVTLIDCDPDGEDCVVAAILFESGHRSWYDCLAEVALMSDIGKRAVLGKYLEGRTARWQKVGRAFENAQLRYEILMDIGAYRDLHRHRMLTQERQLFTVRHGYQIPRDVTGAGLELPYRAALDAVVPFFDRLEPYSPELAQYVVPLANRVRFYQLTNLRECFWEMELRTGSQGHPNYRFVEQEKFRQLKAVYPLIAEFMLVDLDDYPFARRGTDEAIAAREEKVRRGLHK